MHHEAFNVVTLCKSMGLQKFAPRRGNGHMAIHRLIARFGKSKTDAKEPRTQVEVRGSFPLSILKAQRNGTIAF